MYCTIIVYDFISTHTISDQEQEVFTLLLLEEEKNMRTSYSQTMYHRYFWS